MDFLFSSVQLHYAINPREMTKEEKADFLADQKGYGQRYLQLIIQEKRRLKRKRDGAE